MLSLEPNLPIILISGRFAESDARAARALGVRTLLEKPDALMKLPWAVREQLGDESTERSEARVRQLLLSASWALR